MAHKRKGAKMERCGYSRGMKRTRDLFRLYGGRFEIFTSYIAIMYGNVCVKCVSIGYDTIFRIDDSIESALSILMQLTPHQMEKVKEYRKVRKF